jgi:hypothetical protein
MFVLILCLATFFLISGLIQETEEKKRVEESFLEQSMARTHRDKGLDSSLL